MMTYMNTAEMPDSVKSFMSGYQKVPSCMLKMKGAHVAKERQEYSDEDNFKTHDN